MIAGVRIYTLTLLQTYMVNYLHTVTQIHVYVRTYVQKYIHPYTLTNLHVYIQTYVRT